MTGPESNDPWWEFRCPVTWCAGVKRETMVHVANLEEWATDLALNHGHVRRVPNCATCRDIDKVIDIVEASGAAKVLPGT